jgi:hypothetical protein
MKMSLRVAAVLICLAGILLSQTTQINSCRGCHNQRTQSRSTPVEWTTADLHEQAGFGCDICHGGNPRSSVISEAKDPDSGFISRPSGQLIVERCEACHSNRDFMRAYNPTLPVDQAAEYWTSQHGKSLKKGNSDVAQCASCHGAHGIRPIGDPEAPVYHLNIAGTCGQCHAETQMMEKYGISAAVVHEYSEGVHGIAVLENGSRAAPACNDCHGNHGAVVPLGAGSVNETCGICHVHNLNLFKRTTMNRVLSTRDRHGCATCHGAHNIQYPTEVMLGISDGTVCAQCHRPDDRGGQEAQQIRVVMDSLTVALEQAMEMMQYAEAKGYMVDRLALDLLQGQDAMNMARTRVHSFSAAAVRLAATPAFDRFAQVTEKVSGHRQRDRSSRFLYGAPFLLSLAVVGIVALFCFISDKKKKRRGKTG